jgi:hypothetical protein
MVFMTFGVPMSISKSDLEMDIVLRLCTYLHNYFCFSRYFNPDLIILLGGTRDFYSPVL